MPFKLVPTVIAAAALAGQPVGQDPQGPAAPQNPSYFNPQMAIVFDFRGRVSDPDPDQRHFDMKEIEFGFAADVDPYLKAQAFISLAKEDGETKVDIEEATAQYSGLGHGFDLRAGKLKAALGRTNRNHVDALEYLDLPFVLQDVLGDEGLSAPGASLAYLFPGDRFNEVSLDYLDAEADGPLFKGTRLDNPILVGHYRTFFDFTADTSAQLGFSYGHGPNGSGGSAQMYGADYTMKWQPGEKGKSWILEAEAYGSNADTGFGNALGAFAAISYEVRPRLFATVKCDYSESPDSTNVRRGASLGLTLKQTEFSHFRVEYQRISSNFESDRNLLTVQLQYLIGSHPAHKY